MILPQLCPFGCYQVKWAGYDVMISVVITPITGYSLRNFHASGNKKSEKENCLKHVRMIINIKIE